MMEDRSTTIRNYILDKIGSGEFQAGDKLPAARNIAAEMNFSLITVQNAIDELVKEGIVASVARRGTFVHQDWRERILQRNITLFRNGLPWMEFFKEELKQILPAYRVDNGFTRSVLEVRSTYYAQSHHAEYMDMTQIFDECESDKSDFILTPFKSFHVGDKLIGVPIIYSPRVMFYNPVLFEKAGCIEPYSGWSWDEFVDCVHKLKRLIPGKYVFDWHAEPYLWLNFVVRSGGCIIDFEQCDPVRLDSKETRDGLKRYRELRDILGVSLHMRDDDENFNFDKKFMSGEAAIRIDAREFLADIAKSGFEDWKTVTLPRMPDGRDLNTQATDVFCIRNSCVNLEEAKMVLRLLLSERLQNHLAELKYGIPIRKSAAARTIDYGSQNDTLFLAEASKMYYAYNLDSVELYDLVYQSVRSLMNGNDDIDEATGDLATMVRAYLKIKKQVKIKAA